jgi:1,4-alpha-glucan branching enzyme
MNTTYREPAEDSYSARNMFKPVHFFCNAPSARSVCLVGDFNGWNPAAHPMQRQVDGAWFIEVPLTHGHHQYLFIVDGKPELDPKASGIARSDRNERVSLIAVS